MSTRWPSHKQKWCNSTINYLHESNVCCKISRHDARYVRQQHTDRCSILSQAFYLFVLVLFTTVNRTLQCPGVFFNFCSLRFDLLPRGSAHDDTIDLRRSIGVKYTYCTPEISNKGFIIQYQSLSNPATISKSATLCVW